MARPVEPPVEPPKPRVIKGSVGRMLQMKRGSVFSASGGKFRQGFANQLGRRATAAKWEQYLSEGRGPGGCVAACAGTCRACRRSCAPWLQPRAGTPCLHPVLIKGELRSFTTIGRLRSGPHPLDPETPLWYLRTGEDGPDMPLTHMPMWVKRALQNSPGDQAPAPPSPPRVPRRGADPPSPSSSSPDIEIHRIPKLDQTAATTLTHEPQVIAPKASIEPSAPVGGCSSSAAFRALPGPTSVGRGPSAATSCLEDWRS